MKNYSITLLMGLMLIASCKKSSQVDEKPKSEKYAEVIVQAEVSANEMEFLGRYVPSDLLQYPDDGIYLGRGIINRKGIPSGQEITIDFGTGGPCTDGKFRSGKVVIEFNETNFDTMLKPQAYRVGDIELAGNYSIGYVAGTNRLMLNFVVLNGKLSSGSQYTADFTLNRKSEFSQGAATAGNLADDVFTRSELSYDLTLKGDGQTSLLRVRGNGQSKLEFSCNDRYYPTTGQLKVEVAGAGQGSFQLTFGDGSCNSRPVIN